MVISTSLQISGSVGRGGRNRPADVRAVQERLNALMGPSREQLTVDGLSGPLTRGTIGDFQRNVLNFRSPDERVDPAGKTIRALNDANSATLWRRATPAVWIEAMVPGQVPVLAQPSTMSCWATVWTMMHSWRQGRSMTIAEAMDDLGEPWRTNFRNNRGLLWTQTGAFGRAAGLRLEPLQSFSVQGMADLIRQTRSPLFVSIHPLGNAATVTHLVAVVGVRGDGTPDGTNVLYNDPQGGVRLTRTVRQFHARYEASSKDELTVQILHY